MNNYENNPKEFLSKLSDEEFRRLLETAGFDVDDGDGKIIFTNQKEFEWQEKGEVFRMNQRNNFKVNNKQEMTYPLGIKVA